MSPSEEWACPCNGEDHPNWGACVRAKGIRLGANLSDNWMNKHDRELKSYADARRQGIQPATTKQKDIDKAMRLSHERGEPYRA